MNSCSLGTRGKAAGFPVLLGLLDPLLAGGDEIPPDMARAFQRIAAEKHHPRRLQRLHGDAVAGPKDQQPRPFIALVGDLDLAIDDIDRALLVIGVERHADALLRRDLGVEPGRDHRDRRCDAEGTARDHARGEAAIGHHRQIAGRIMLERRRDLFVACRQRDPALQAQHLLARRALHIRRALGMGDAAAGRHQVHRARLDLLDIALAVAMHDAPSNR